MKLLINKRELEFTFGLGFLGELLEDVNLGIDELLTKAIKNPFKWFPVIVYHSAKYKLEEDGKDVDFTLKDIREWIELDGAFTEKNKSMAKFSTAFINSLTKGVPKEDDAEDGGSKKK